MNYSALRVKMFIHGVVRAFLFSFTSGSETRFFVVVVVCVCMIVLCCEFHPPITVAELLVIYFLPDVM